MLLKDSEHEIIDWDECFMRMAHVISWRSKDPNTQVGSVVVDEKNVVVGMGYNGFPRHTRDKDFPWARDAGFLESKYAYVVHAEENAIYNSNAKVDGCRLYCLLFPCNECAKTIIQCGIKEVVYENDKYPEEDIYVASRRLFDSAGVKYRHYQTAWGQKSDKDKNGSSGVEIKIKKVHPDAVVPSYAKQGDAGLDLTAVEAIEIEPHGRAKIDTGLAFEIPQGFVGLIWDRSGLSTKKGLKSLGGVIDSGYRGSIMVGLANVTDEVVEIEKGERVAQILIQPVAEAKISEVQGLSESERGTDGFGSTDRDFVKVEEIILKKEETLKEEDGSKKGRW